MNFLATAILLLTPLLLAPAPVLNTPAVLNTWNGFVTDTHCGTNCQRTTTMTPDLACIRRCVKQGSKYGLWSGHHVYLLEPQSRAAKFAAENVRVTGSLSNDTIYIQSIEHVSQ
jgi:hypothetical protein